MPPIRKNRSKPSTYEIIEQSINDINNKIRDYELNNDNTGIRKDELYWPIFRLQHQRSRIIYNAYINKQITKECYDYCTQNKYIDTVLASKWKKQGYEKLCCIRCIQSSSTNFNTNCICRVPKSSRDNDNNEIIQCKNCGCTGCASSD